MDYHFTVLSDWLSNGVTYSLKPILLLLYSGAAGLLYYRYRRSPERKTAAAQAKVMDRWIPVFLAFQLLMITCYSTIMILLWTKGRGELFYTANVLLIASATGMTGLFISPFFFPQILYGLPVASQAGITSEAAFRDDKTKDRKNSFALEKEYIESIKTRSDEYMEKEKPYLLPDLNLNQFAVMIQIPVHHLYYYFREIRKQAFTDYRNKFRIQHAKMLMESENSKLFTLESIGRESGFSSRNSFFTSFKAIEGVSPGTFWSNN